MTIETEQENDGRWLADVVELPGVMAYGSTEEEAVQKAMDLAREVGDLRMRRLILNAAMIPCEGTWRYRRITSQEAAEWLRSGPAESFVGYPQTADHITSLSGVTVPLNRAKVEGLLPGDQALVVKLAYRVADPATKGQPVPEDWEYGLLEMVRQSRRVSPADAGPSARND